MGHRQMLRVSKAEGWLVRPRAASSVRPDQRAQGTRGGDARAGDSRVLGDCVIIRSRAEEGRRSGDLRPDGSGPSSGSQELRLHLALIPPGSRGLPHLHADHETAIYVVSGEAEVWHGPGLARRSAARAGDFIYIPPGTPHLAVNRSDVTSIAVVGRSGRANQTSAVMIELPRHLDGLASFPVADGE
jgi:uncharacterized RmlC-like cupin family protein